MKTIGKVTLVGAGPGDPDLLTVKALRLLADADVVVYDRLVSDDILALISPNAERVPVGKAPRHHPVPQDEINRILIKLARDGRDVVRLKGGDPFIFGRGSEETEELFAAGVPFDVVPGITAAQGASASTGVPLTHRGLANSVRYITGHCRADQPLDFDWQGLCDPHTTLVIYMGHANIAEITSSLIAHGRAHTTPVLAVSRASRADQSVRLSSLGAITADVAEGAFEAPVLFVVGEVATLYRSQDNVLPAEIVQVAREVCYV
ncbi:MAG: uroporphyrinogen-III C-methyltransferase [Hyphomicrobiales bacterium]|nr:MAG: uroporphyrinogen-III C-methyltransferase [Hyphomicrobiales bacterium]